MGGGRSSPPPPPLATLLSKWRSKGYFFRKITKIALRRPSFVMRLCCNNLFSTPDRLQFLDEKILSFAQVGKGLGAEAPAEIFSGGGQATYPLSIGSNKTLQLQPGFC